MFWKNLDFSPRGRARVYLLTAIGTLICIAVTVVFDGYQWREGVWDLGPRPMNDFLIPIVLAVPFFFLLLSKMRELAIAQHELVHLASTDELTSCLNRRAFMAIVDTYLERMDEREPARPGGAFMIADIDYFKNVNDRYGHDTGDKVLQLVARTIREAVRHPDLVGRLGGEEFGIFLPATDETNAHVVGERVRKAVAAADFREQGLPNALTISVGGTIFDRTTSYAELYHLADRMLYAAKNAGRNRIDIRQIPRTATTMVPQAVAAPLA